MSASIAPSNLTETLASARAFCVVCGKVTDDLQMRSSGLKCKNCVGKRSNRHWVKLQKRQATQLLGELAAPASSMRPTSSGTNSPPPTTLDLLSSRSDDLMERRQSIMTPSSSVSGSSRVRRGKKEAISDYISGTTVFQKAMHRTHHVDALEGADLDEKDSDDVGSKLGTSPSHAHKVTSPPPPVSRRSTGGMEEFSTASSVPSTTPSSLTPTPTTTTAPTTPPAGGPPRRLGSSRMQSSLSQPDSVTNGVSQSVTHSAEIHVPLSRPSATSMTPKVITPSSKDHEPRRGSARDGDAALVQDSVAVTTAEATKKTSAPQSTVTSPDSVPLPLPITADTTRPPLAGRNGRLPQRPSPGCVVSVIEPERGGGGGGAGLGHQRVISFSVPDASTAEHQDVGSAMDYPLEPPPAPMDHSRCPSTASCSGTGLRLPSRSPAAITSPSKPSIAPLAKSQENKSVTAQGEVDRVSVKGVTAKKPTAEDEGTSVDDEEEADDAHSSASGSSSYVTNESCVVNSHGAASAGPRGGGRAGDDVSGGDVPPPLTLNLDRLDVAVLFVSPAQLAAEAAARLPGGGLASEKADERVSRENSLAASVSSLSAASSSSSSVQRRRSQVTVNGAFTVTRPAPNKALHARTRSTDVSAAAAAAAPSAAAAAAPTGPVEVRRLQFRFCVKDRDSGEGLFHVDRSFFKEVMPALEAVRKVAGGSSGCPALPSKALPSVRYATDAYVAERRSEVDAITRFIVTDAFLVRHPAIVKLLELDPALHHGPQATATSTAPVQASSSSSSSAPAGQHRRRRGSHGADGEASAPYLDSHSLDPLRLAGASKTRRGAVGSQASGHSSSRSSVVRRSRLDCVTAEDLEKVQLGTVIGRGSFGTVCQGYLQTTSGPVVVAVKRVHVNPQVTENDTDVLGEAQGELDILRKAKHKNIVRFLGSLFSPTAMELSVFTEYVECGTLASMVERFGCLPLLAIQKYMRQILEGLSYLHQLSIVHRDIKGENVLVTKNGRVKLTDFGSSGVLNEVGSASVMPMGSPLWMAPEILHGEVAEAPGDIWAVGCVGIEMLDRTIWQVTTNDAVNPFVFMYRIGKLGTPPQGLPTAEEVEAFKTRGEQEAYECYSVYRDFLVQCLQVKPEDRWTADQLLQHPFIHTPFSRYIRWQAPEAKPA